ncbi:MAG: Sir2 family NAD-dependent protein deacetylase, partial [Bacilli bacterium]
AKKKDVTVITQNIDGLHQKAGSKNVIELHGSILRNHCINCREEYDLDYILNENGIPRCEKCHGIVKPDVVLFEEPLDEAMLSKAIKAIQNADLLLIIGSSLIVQPAASLPCYFISRNIAIINRDATLLDKYAKLVIRDDIIDVFSYLREER